MNAVKQIADGGDANECDICCESQNDGLLPCGHPVHVKCLEASGKKECPMCRRPYTDVMFFGAATASPQQPAPAQE